MSWIWTERLIHSVHIFAKQAKTDKFVLAQISALGKFLGCSKFLAFLSLNVLTKILILKQKERNWLIFSFTEIPQFRIRTSLKETFVGESSRLFGVWKKKRIKGNPVASHVATNKILFLSIEESKTLTYFPIKNNG